MSNKFVLKKFEDELSSFLVNQFSGDGSIHIQEFAKVVDVLLFFAISLYFAPFLREGKIPKGATEKLQFTIKDNTVKLLESGLEVLINKES